MSNKFSKSGNLSAVFLMSITALFYTACQKFKKLDIYFMLALFMLVHLLSLNWVNSVSEINTYLKVILTDLCSQLRKYSPLFFSLSLEFKNLVNVNY